MPDWSESQVLARREGLSQREIARRLGIFWVTVKWALVSEGPPGHERAGGPTSFDPFAARVRALLVRFPGMSASVVIERAGWVGGSSALRRYISRSVSNSDRWILRIGWNMSRVISVNVICGFHR